MKSEKNQILFETALIAIIILLVFLQCRSCQHQRDKSLKNEMKTEVRTDTIYKLDTFFWTKYVLKKNIEPKAVVAADSNNKDFVFFGNDGEGAPANVGAPDLSIWWYSDTTRGPDYSIVIDDSIQQSRIMSRKVSFNDRRVTLQTIVTEKIPPKKEFPLRAYLGLYAYRNKAGQWGVGPSAIISTRFGLAAMYAFDIHQAQHTVGVYYLLRFKKLAP